MNQAAAQQRSATRTSTLARLIAAENMSVRVDNSARAAVFDLKTRQLTLPNFSGLTERERDLVICHECGHALFTPPAQYAAIAKTGKMVAKILNVVEDTRIEKEVQKKFPGSKKDFIEGYKGFLDKDFFGIEGHDLAEFSLIDRLNLHFKAGNWLPTIPFSPKEQVIVDDMTDNLNSFDDVGRIVQKIAQEMNAQSESSQDQEGDNREGKKSDKSQRQGGKDSKSSSGKSGKSQSGNGEPTDQDKEENQDDDQQSDENDADGDSQEEDNSDSDGNESDNDSSNQSESNSNSTSSKSPPGKASQSPSLNQIAKALDAAPNNNKSGQTIDNLAGNLKDNTANQGNHRNSLTVPFPKINLADYVIPAQTMQKKFKEYYRNGIGYGNTPKASENLRNFLRTENSTISALMTEFELRRNAFQMLRTKDSKTGTINSHMLHKYTIADDIFQRNHFVPDQQNHGVVLLLDQSASMQSIYSETIERVIFLAEFCRRARVPCEIYGFSSNTCGFNLPQKQLVLKQYLTSNASGKDFRKCLEMLQELHDGNFPDFEQLGQTPLCGAMMVSVELLEKFRTENRLDIVNFIVLTDGDPTDVMSSFPSMRHLATAGNRINLVKNGVISNNIQGGDYLTLVDFTRKVTGARMLCVHLVPCYSASSLNSKKKDLIEYKQESGVTTFDAEYLLTIRSKDSKDNQYKNLDNRIALMKNINASHYSQLLGADANCKATNMQLAKMIAKQIA